MTALRRFIEILVDGTHADSRAAIGGCIGFVGGLVTGVQPSKNIFEFGWHTGALTLFGSLGGVLIVPIGIICGVYGIKRVIAKHCRIEYCRRDYDQCEY